MFVEFLGKGVRGLRVSGYRAWGSGIQGRPRVPELFFRNGRGLICWQLGTALQRG